MRPRTVAAVAAFILCVSFVVAQSSTTAEPYDVEEAYKVYSVLVPHEESAESTMGMLVIQEETVSKPEASEACLTKEAAIKFKDAIAGYNSVNTKKWLLQRQFQMEKPYELVGSDTIGILLKQDGWDAFYKRYPGVGGYVILSAVGFNKDKTQAIVYTGSSCGNLCGRWSFHLLEKVGGNWREAPGVSCVTVS